MEGNQTEEVMKHNAIHYDAFISYRHSETDKFVAENLHKQLEAFRMPKSLQKKRKGMKNQIDRIFRDREELPLTSDLNDPIMNALHNSDWLIVICSPRLRESLWCKKEIETFVKLNGRERVLAVLIEGEPEESFPDELLFKTETVTKSDGSIEEIKIPVEPLAADVRGKDKNEILKLMKTEMLRILAAMFHVNYDDLRQRHKEQRMRRITTVSIIAAVTCLVFSIFFGIMTLYMYRQKQTIQGLMEVQEKQFQELQYQQALELAEKSVRYMEEDRRELAVQTAVESLTQYDFYTMPDTPQGYGALIESLRCYDTGVLYKAQYEFETSGVVVAMDVAPGQKKVAILDYVNRLYIWDVETNETEAMLSIAENGTGKDTFTFLDDDRIAYYSADDTISIYSISANEVIKEINNGYTDIVCLDSESRYLILSCREGYEVYSTDSYELLGIVNTQEEEKYPYIFFAQDDDIMAFLTETEREGQKIYTIQFVELATQNVLCDTEISFESSVEIKIRDGIAYIMHNRFVEEGNSFTTCIQAFDIKMNSVKWQVEAENTYSGVLAIPKAETGQNLLVTLDSNIMLIDMETGAVLKKAAMNDAAIAGDSYETADSYTVITEGGGIYMIDEVNLDIQDISAYFEMHTERLSYYANTACGPLMVPDNSNRVILFYQQRGEDMVPVEKQNSNIQGRYYYSYEDEAVAALEEYQVEDADLVHGLFYDAEETYIFICYNDKRVSVYTTRENILLSTFEAEDLPTQFLGTDYNDCSYIQATWGGYILDKDMQLCCYVPGLTSVDKENNKICIIDNWGQCYETPIYTMNELLKMSTPYLDDTMIEYLELMDYSSGD